jgi:acetyl-CoA carboxylase carboxyltransferase component
MPPAGASEPSTSASAGKPSSVPANLRALSREILAEEERIKSGGGPAAIDRQHARRRLTARERIAELIDRKTEFFELGIWAGHGMYDDWGGAPAAGVVTGIGTVSGRRFVVIANDATVKAGAFFPATAKKVLRAQRIAMENRVPLIYLVDSAGVFLPLQDEVFPDEDDFGRIFRNNAVISAAGIPQFAAIMGSCVAGGGYLPVLCDKLLMTEGSGLYLAGPALVKAAIGQTVSDEELGGAAMHTQVSGTVDFREPDDHACLRRLRAMADLLPADESRHIGVRPGSPFPPRCEPKPAKRDGQEPYSIVPADGRGEYDVRRLLECVLDADTFEEYKAEYGQSLVCGYARLDGYPVGVVANQRKRSTPAAGAMQFGGVIYVDSADKAARFVMDCNQGRLPIVFFQDVNGFMVGRDAERDGIIRSGAKLVNAVSNSVVPKITVVVGGSYGAGNYALCGKAFDPRLIFAWPNARYAVMGGSQAADTLFSIEKRALERAGRGEDAAELEALRKRVAAEYERQTDIRYAAARGWVDKVIDPARTRESLATALELAVRSTELREFKTGVMQV